MLVARVSCDAFGQQVFIEGLKSRFHVRGFLSVRVTRFLGARYYRRFGLLFSDPVNLPNIIFGPFGKRYPRRHRFANVRCKEFLFQFFALFNNPVELVPDPQSRLNRTLPAARQNICCTVPGAGRSHPKPFGVKTPAMCHLSCRAEVSSEISAIMLSLSESSMFRSAKIRLHRSIIPWDSSDEHHLSRVK